MYLTDSNSSPYPSTNGEIQLRNQVLHRISSNFGGYTHADTSDYQIMLNYQRANQSFQEVALVDVLADKVSPDQFRDRAILIGSTSEVSKDFLSTPYHDTQLGTGLMPGVVIHAHAVSQIISAVLDTRPLILDWPEWGECLWILLWIAIGTLTTFIYRKIIYLVFATIVLASVLSSACYFLLLSGYWIPFAAPALGLFVTIMSISTQRRVSEYRLQATIQVLKTIKTEN
jgi:adenylate cyclase